MYDPVECGICCVLVSCSVGIRVLSHTGSRCTHCVGCAAREYGSRFIHRESRVSVCTRQQSMGILYPCVAMCDTERVSLSCCTRCCCCVPCVCADVCHMSCCIFLCPVCKCQRHCANSRTGGCGGNVVTLRYVCMCLLCDM